MTFAKTWYSDFDKNLTGGKFKKYTPRIGRVKLKEEDHLIFDLDLNSIKEKKNYFTSD